MSVETITRKPIKTSMSGGSIPELYFTLTRNNPKGDEQGFYEYWKFHNVGQEVDPPQCGYVGDFEIWLSEKQSKGVLKGQHMVFGKAGMNYGPWFFDFNISHHFFGDIFQRPMRMNYLHVNPPSDEETFGDAVDYYSTWGGIPESAIQAHLWNARKHLAVYNEKNFITKPISQKFVIDIARRHREAMLLYESAPTMDVGATYLASVEATFYMKIAELFDLPNQSRTIVPRNLNLDTLLLKAYGIENAGVLDILDSLK